MNEELIWLIYNIIREIEYSIRTLKTDLDLRPIYHKKDDPTMAHLHLGLLAYWIVNTVRYQLKGCGAKETAQVKTQEQEQEQKQKQEQEKGQENDIEHIQIQYNSQWKEIIRMMHTQKAVTTVSQNCYDQVIISHRCSDPTPKVEAIYRRLNYKPYPFTKRKFVAHFTFL